MAYKKEVVDKPEPEKSFSISPEELKKIKDFFNVELIRLWLWLVVLD